MQKLLTRFQRPKIQTRLVIYYIIFAAVTVAAVTYFAYSLAVQSLRDAVEDKLTTVAELKKDSLDQWVDDQQRNAIFLASLPELRSLTGTFLNLEWSPEEQRQAQVQLTNLLRVIVQRTNDFQDIQIIDLNGSVVVSLRPPDDRHFTNGAAFFSGRQK
jgi:hypothetical protein